MVLFFNFVVAVIILQALALPEYHQNDYDVKFERATVLSYNRKFVKDLYIDFPFHNRSTRVANASGYLLQDMTSTDVVIEIELFKFLSNEYRHFPLRVGTNFCNEYANNNFNAQNILKEISNLAPCPLKKGFYYAYNIPMDCSRLPPFIPRGRYKNSVKIFYNKIGIADLEGYFEIADKPIKWMD